MLVLIAHGSRNADWRGSLEKLTSSVQAGTTDEEVRLAYMQFAEPSLQQVVEESVARGVNRFRFLPLFMASAGHVDKDIKPMVADLVRQFPDVGMELLGPLGENSRLPALILRIVNNTLL
jgi:sirohydrochlorin cobaltochelatase